MRQPTVRDLWREYDLLTRCVREATEAQRKGQTTYETTIAMPAKWRYRPERGHAHVFIARCLPVEIVQPVTTKRIPPFNRVLWVRGDVHQALTRGWVRLHGVEASLQNAYHVTPEEWEGMTLERGTPCERCRVRFFGGLVRWRQKVYREIEVDPLLASEQELLDFEAEQEEYLREVGIIKEADYRAYAQAHGAAW